MLLLHRVAKTGGVHISQVFCRHVKAGMHLVQPYVTCWDPTGIQSSLRMLWHAMACYGMLWHAMGRYGMLWNAMGCYSDQFAVINITLRRVQ